MKLFDPVYLFKDFEKEGFKNPLDNNELFEEEKKEEVSTNQSLREKIG